MMKSHFVLTFILVLATAVPLAATAQDKDDFTLGVTAYEEGDYENAAKLWTPLAKEGSAEAQQNLAQLYHLGLGVERDNAKAYELFQAAAEQNSVTAQVNAALLLLTGEGMRKNPQQAALWFAKAADQGDALAQYNLGLMYEEGTGVPKNNDVAVELYQLAANQGQKKAEKRLAIALGTSVQKPLTSPTATNDPAVVARPRTSEVEVTPCPRPSTLPDFKSTANDFQAGVAAASLEDYTQAAEIWSHLVCEDYSKAIVELAELYRLGLGVERNEMTAYELYKTAAEQNSAIAQLNAGLYLLEGKIIEKNPKQAARWFAKAADQGDRDAQFALGLMYEQGDGIEQDHDIARELYQLAANQGLSKAHVRILTMKFEEIKAEANVTAKEAE